MCEVCEFVAGAYVYGVVVVWCELYVLGGLLYEVLHVECGCE